MKTYVVRRIETCADPACRLCALNVPGEPVDSGHAVPRWRDIPAGPALTLGILAVILAIALVAG